MTTSTITSTTATNHPSRRNLGHPGDGVVQLEHQHGDDHADRAADPGARPFVGRIVGGTSGVKDSTGTAMTTDFTWRFTTATEVSASGLFQAPTAIPIGLRAALGSDRRCRQRHHPRLGGRSGGDSTMAVSKGAGGWHVRRAGLLHDGRQAEVGRARPTSTATDGSTRSPQTRTRARSVSSRTRRRGSRPRPTPASARARTKSPSAI